MDILELITKAGPSGIIAGLFVWVLQKLLENNKQQQEAHRTEIKEMRAEHTAQVTAITDKFSDEIKGLGSEFSAGMNSLKDGLNHIAEELRDVKLKVNIKNEVHND